MKQIFFIFIFSALTLYSHQEVYTPKPIYNNDEIFKLDIDDKNKQNNPQSSHQLSDNDLTNNEQLTAIILDKSIENGHWENVKHLLLIYSQFNFKDEILFNYAEARLAHYGLDFERAITLYKNILSINKTLLPIRVYLIKALMEDKRFTEALQEIEIVELSDNNEIPQDTVQIIKHYKEICVNDSLWQISSSGYYFIDKNINETSSDRNIKIGNFEFLRDEKSLPQTGKGISYGLGMRKNFFIKEQNYYTLNIINYGKYYFDKNEYNDHIARVASGYSISSGIKNISFGLFFQKRFFSNESYNKSYGYYLNSSFNYINFLQLSQSFEFGKNNYIERNFLDGDYFTIALGIQKRVLSSLVLFSELNLYKNTSNDDSESFLRKNIQFGILYPLGDVYLKTLVGYGNKQYEFNPLFGVDRKDIEFNYGVVLWSNKIHFFDFIPKLNLEVSSTSSNINIFTYNKTKYYFSFERKF